MRLDLWKLVLHIIRIHGLDLLSRRSAEHFDDFDELVDPAFAREEGLAEH